MKRGQVWRGRGPSWAEGDGSKFPMGTESAHYLSRQLLVSALWLSCFAVFPQTAAFPRPQFPSPQN